MTDSANVHGTRGNSMKTLQQLKTKRSTLKGTITRIMNQIDLLIKKDSMDGVSEVSSKYNQLQTTVNAFKDVHFKYHSTLKDECDVDESLEYYTSVEMKVSNCLAKVSEWIERQKSIVEASIAEQISILSDEINPEDSASNVSSHKSKSPKSSKTSQKSTSTTKSSSASIRLQVSAKRAALEAESTTLLRRQSLEMKECLLDSEFQRQQLDQEKARLSLQQEKERLALETELYKIHAEEKVYFNVELSHVNQYTTRPNLCRDSGMIGMQEAIKVPSATRSDDFADEEEIEAKEVKEPIYMSFTPNEKENGKISLKSPNDYSTPLNPNASPWQQTSNKPPEKQEENSNDESTLPFQCLTELQRSHQEQSLLIKDLLQQQKEQTLTLSLPRPEMLIFNGDPASYCEFIRAFENIIEVKTSSSSARLYYLIQYTTGDVQELMRSCLTMNPNEGYTTARKLLKGRYGQDYKISAAFTERIKKFPPIKPEDNQSLQRFSILMTSCRTALKDIGYVNKLDNPDLYHVIIDKLPINLKKKFRDVADNISEEQKREITIEDITKFIDKQARAANHPIFGNLFNHAQETKNRNTKTYESKPVKAFFPAPRAGSFATVSEPVTSEPVSTKSIEETKSPTCPMCDLQGHWLSRCGSFKAKSVEERLKFVRSKGLCDNCLNSGHVAGSCPKNSFCKVENCSLSRKHSSFLHPKNNERSKNKPTNQASGDKAQSSFINSQALCNSTGAGTPMTGLSIVPVKVRTTENDSCVETYAFLDPGSNTTFCTDQLINHLGISGEQTELSLTTMNSDNVMRKCQRVTLQVYDLEEKNCVVLPKVFSCPKLPVSTKDIPQQIDVDRWQHLEGIQLPSIYSDVDLLIGNDVVKALEPKQVIESQDGGPYAVRTVLGWTINGPLGRRETQTHTANRIHSDVQLNEQFEQYCNIEFNDTKHHDDTTAMSLEDKRALHIMEESATLKDGHYEVALPWRSFPPELSNNKVIAEQRLNSLKKRLLKDSTLHANYSKFMKDLEQKGYSQRVPEEKKTEGTKAWYLPHHPVSHPQKPEKTRSVFDCAAKHNGSSLNDKLLQGPDLTNTLIGVLSRFREESTALMADIESMFYQVHVRSEDSDYLRYLWWPDGNLAKEPEEYQMCVHLFGGVSSPSCASFALRKTAEDNKSSFSEEAVTTVKRNFYVDDCLKSMDGEQKSIQIVNELRNLLSLGGFRLTKWLSNSKEVLKAIPESERAGCVRNLDLEHLPIERALGIQWNVQSDTFGFKITVKDRPATRRGLLSMMSSIYDPLGFVAPYILEARAIIQDLCRKKLDWDDEIPQEDLDRWQLWLQELPKLEHFTIERCLKPKDFGSIASCQLHNFSDASERGYGAVSYLRLVDCNGKIHCSFVLGKSRLTPMKKVTIPRLELSAAATATKVSSMIRRELDLPIDEDIYWTDSTCALGYITNEDRRFKTFVANKISVIHENSQPSQWRYVNTKLNPADDASRGLSAEELVNNERWIKGPDFLWSSEDDWPKLPDTTIAVQEDDPEVKEEIKAVSFATNSGMNPIDRMIHYYSSWYRLKKHFAWILRYRNRLLRAVRARKDKEALKYVQIAPLTTEEMQNAETEILKYIQRQHFAEEVLETSTAAKKSSQLSGLDPIKVSGLLRVGGRLRRSTVTDETKHPIILPKHHHVVDLIVRETHLKSGHSGQEHVLALIRSTYWIIKARVTIRRILNQCIPCKKRQAPLSSQKMGDLPAERLTPDKPPFSAVGVDCFGPFYVKRGRSQVKRYGVLYTCLAIRAIHLEVLHSMDTDSFINSLMRFIARRGKPESIRSDNGTNFVAGNKEISKAIEQWNSQRISEFLLQRQIKWLFNPPAASHQGGVWERCIRTVRKVLDAVTKEQVLDDEGLSTLFCEVERIINSRPITKTSDDPKDLEPLSPNHLLLLRSESSLPPGVFTNDDVYSKRKWKQVQYLADLFWRRWIQEYLPTLQRRQKWLRPSRNFCVNDIVLVVDDRLPRGSWPLGRITGVRKNPRDGLVRSVTVKTKSSVLDRPITKIVLLEAVEVTDTT